MRTTEVVRGIIKVENTADGRIAINVEQREGGAKKTGYRKGAALIEQEFYEHLTGEDVRNGCRTIIETMQRWGVIAGWRTAAVSLQLPAPEGPTTRFTLCVITTKGEAHFDWLHSQLERVFSCSSAIVTK